jgi:hypothetical protein
MNFAGSTRAPRTQSRAKSGEVPGLRSAGVTTNAGSAADAVSTAAIYGELRANAPKYDDIASTAAENRMNERVSAMNAEANMASAGISAAGQIAAAEEQAKAMKAQGAAAEKGGMMSAIGGIASAAIPLLSDESTKHTIDTIEDALETLRNLRPVTFFYKEEYSSSPERMHHGFIAQEYKEVMPDATYYDESIGKMCIDTSELISLLVRANQQLETRITRLEAKHALEAV